MAKDTKYYLDKGFEPRMAKYFAGGRRIIVSVEANKDFTLTLIFDNGEKKLYDMKPLLKQGTVFEPFLDYENFKRVYLDDIHCVAWDIDPDVDSNIFWNNKVDLSSDTCYVDSVSI